MLVVGVVAVSVLGAALAGGGSRQVAQWGISRLWRECGGCCRARERRGTFMVPVRRAHPPVSGSLCFVLNYSLSVSLHFLFLPSVAVAPHSPYLTFPWRLAASVLVMLTDH